MRNPEWRWPRGAGHTAGTADSMEAFGQVRHACSVTVAPQGGKNAAGGAVTSASTTPGGGGGGNGEAMGAYISQRWGLGQSVSATEPLPWGSKGVYQPLHIQSWQCVLNTHHGGVYMRAQWITLKQSHLLFLPVNWPNCSLDRAHRVLFGVTE